MVSFRSAVLSLLRIHVPPRGFVQIGKYTSGTPFTISTSRMDNVIIGKFCSIASDVVMIPSLGHIPPRKYRHYRVSTYPLARLIKRGWQEHYELPEVRNFIVVGNDVWIGARAIILPGVTIGDGVIIGAGAVVTHDVPPYAIIAGVPSKVLRFRYAEDQIEKLLKIAWWDWSLKKIAANLDYFYGDVQIFIDRFSKEKTPSKDQRDSGEAHGNDRPVVQKERASK